jgi:histone deacetylase 11
VWSPAYRVSFYGIERLHPFDVAKYDTIAQGLVDGGLVPEDGFLVPDEPPQELLERVHDPAYLASLRNPAVLSAALEVPVPGFLPAASLDARVLAPMRTAAGGTLAAARAALESGFAVNLGGGFHHARPDLGHGFCVYNDVALAVRALRDEGFAGKVLIVDTDAHQGDGNHTFFANDPDVITLSLQQEGIFPQPRVPGTYDIELPAGTTDDEFLAPLGHRLDLVLQRESIGLVFHVAGADVLKDDPLADLSLTIDGLVRRDLLVMRLVRSRDVPLVHLLAGGYGSSAAPAQLRSVSALLEEARK